MEGHWDAHVPARVVVVAAGLTLAAAAAEVLGAWRSGSLFLGADAMHLVAHLSIFGILLIPSARTHEHREDVAAVGVLTIIAIIAVGIISEAAACLRQPITEPPEAAYLALSLLGLGANLATAYLFHDPARTRWSFRAALAHELADAAVTVAALFGAIAIALFRWRWIDPGLTLVVGIWLIVWAGRLLVRRAYFGSDAWTLEKD